MKVIKELTAVSEDTIKVDGYLKAIQFKSDLTTLANAVIQVTRKMLNGQSEIMIPMQPLTELFAMANLAGLQNVYTATEAFENLPIANGNVKSSDVDFIEIFITGLDDTKDYTLSAVESLSSATALYNYARTNVDIKRYSIPIDVNPSNRVLLVSPILKSLEVQGSDYSIEHTSAELLNQNIAIGNNDGFKVAAGEISHVVPTVYLHSLVGVNRFTYKSAGVTASYFIIVSESRYSA